MTHDLFGELDTYLKELEAAQAEQQALLSKKHAALTSVATSEMIALAGAESQLATRITNLLDRRGRLLEFAEQLEISASTLRELVVAGDPPNRANLLMRIDRSRETATSIRRESWVHWIISQRNYNHYTEMLELIAHCGEKSPTYSKGPGRDRSGSAILDASA